MDIRVLQYFLTVAREESISRAAEALHMTQPPLSRQLKELEDELGKQLFIRGSRHITLTAEGQLLRRRAEEMVSLMARTRQEIQTASDHISGDIYIGSGETDGLHIVASAIRRTQNTYPDIRYHLYSGNANDIAEKLDQGLLDFGLFLGSVNKDKYNYVKLPHADTWGLVLPREHPLAAKNCITPQDLHGLPLICSRQMLEENSLTGWLGSEQQHLNIVATYNLSAYTLATLANAGAGCILAFDKLLNTSDTTGLCFRPLEPQLKADMYLGWKKYQLFSKAAHAFLEQLKIEVTNE